MFRDIRPPAQVALTVLLLASAHAVGQTTNAGTPRSQEPPEAGLPSPASAEICGDCHRAAQEAWKSSAHAHSMDSRLFQDALYYTGIDLGSSARGSCLGCHSPLAAAIGDAGMKTKVSWEGVTCDYCHSVRQVSMEGRNPAAKLEFTRVRTGPWQGETPGRHGALYSDLHASSLVCAPCHEYRNALGFPVITTFSEWQESPYAKEGHSCQFCHMPDVDRVALVQRIVAAPTDQERHSHCQSCHVATAGAAPGQSPSSGGHLRQRGRLNLHEMTGSRTADLLARAVTARLAAVREANQVKVTVDIANQTAGHYVPTGSPLRKLVLEVHADTDNGQHLVQERTYQRIVADREAKPVQLEYMAFERGARVISDTRLAPAETRSEVFRFDVPAGVHTRISFAFRYFYSPLSKTESQRNTTFLKLGTDLR